MPPRIRRGAALTAILAAVAIGATAAPALATFTEPFNNYAVSGFLTLKKLNEKVVLPKHSTFNGAAVFAALPPTPGWSAAVNGKLYVPPFETTVTLGGLAAANIHSTLTQVGEAEGTIAEAPPADCPNPTLPGACATMTTTSNSIIGITEVGLLGIDTPTECETETPVVFNLSTHLTFEELSEIGPHFSGTVTIPNMVCHGASGVAVGAALTALMSGPENPYELYIAPREAAAPSFVPTEEASRVSQASAVLHGRVDPEGAALTGCEFEYGTTTSYGSSVPCQPEVSTINKRPFTGSLVTGQLAGLSEGTAYHYRIAATNSLGTSYGADQTFTTLGPAGAPEYGTCVAQKGGVYSNAGCTTVAEKKGVATHKGKYEWVAGPSSCLAKKKGEYTNSSCTTKSAKAKKGTYEKTGGPGYTASSGSVTLETPGLAAKLVCTASTASGELTGVSSGVERLTLTGCESAGTKCTSEGSNSTPSGTAGVIITNLLDTRLLGSATAVWTQLASGEHEPYLAEFGCGSLRYRTSGAVAGIQAGDVGAGSVTSTTTLASETAEQALSTAVSENGGSSWSEAHPSTLATVLSTTAATPTEIKP